MVSKYASILEHVYDKMTTSKTRLDAAGRGSEEERRNIYV